MDILPPEIVEKILIFLSYQEIINLIDVSENYALIVKRALKEKKYKEVQLLVHMKSTKCDTIPMAPRMYQFDLECQSWCSTVKFSLPTHYHCSEKSFRPAGCDFLFNYVAGQNSCTALESKPCLTSIVKYFKQWNSLPNKEKYACFVAYSYMHLDEEFRQAGIQALKKYHISHFFQNTQPRDYPFRVIKQILSSCANVHTQLLRGVGNTY